MVHKSKKMRIFDQKILEVANGAAQSIVERSL